MTSEYGHYWCILIVGKHQNMDVLDEAFLECEVAVLEDEGGDAGQWESLEEVLKMWVWFKLCPKDYHQCFGV